MSGRRAAYAIYRSVVDGAVHRCRRRSLDRWEGYDLLVNESLRDDRRTSVRAYGRDDWGKPATIDYRYEGNEMMVAVPRKFFGSGKLSFDFHWADGIQKLGDIDEFLLNGDQAPSRRANYHFEE